MTPPNAHTQRTLPTPQPQCYHELPSIQEEGQKQEQSYGKKINVQGKNGEEEEELRNKLLSLIVLIALLNFIQVRIHKDKKTK